MKQEKENLGAWLLLREPGGGMKQGQNLRGGGEGGLVPQRQQGRWGTWGQAAQAGGGSTEQNK